MREQIIAELAADHRRQAATAQDEA